MDTLDFKPLDDAQVTQTEFAAILGVSRITTNRWIRGAMPSPLARRSAQALLDELAKAVEAGLLPGSLVDLPPSKHTVEERRQLIDAALEQVRLTES